MNPPIIAVWVSTISIAHNLLKAIQALTMIRTIVNVIWVVTQPSLVMWLSHSLASRNWLLVGDARMLQNDLMGQNHSDW